MDSTTATSLQMTTIRFEVDPDEELCFRGDAGGQPLRLRLDPAFPDRPAWSASMPDGVTWSIEDLPAAWSLPPGPWQWPASARPAPAYDPWD